MLQTAALVLHSAGEGIYGLDAEGLTTFSNPAAEAMVGWTAEELIGTIRRQSNLNVAPRKLRNHERRDQ